MKDSRYIDRQIIPYGCGPIALMNAIKWAGCDFPWQELRPHFEAAGFQHATGVQNSFATRVLRMFGIPYVIIKRPRVETIERCLAVGRPVILSYIWKQPTRRPTKEAGGHMIFIDGHEGQFFNAYNVNGNGAEYKPVMEQYLRNGSVLWMLDKPEAP